MLTLPHMKKAATAARTAATLYPATRTASLDGTTDGTGVALGAVLLVLFDAATTKFAQVMRVVLLVWMTIDLPATEAKLPAAVERNGSLS